MIDVILLISKLKVDVMHLKIQYDTWFTIFNYYKILNRSSKYDTVII